MPLPHVSLFPGLRLSGWPLASRIEGGTTRLLEADKPPASQGSRAETQAGPSDPAALQKLDPPDPVTTM